MSRIWIAPVCTVLFAAACQSAPPTDTAGAHAAHGDHAAAAPRPVELLPGLGDARVPITTQDELAQAFFDQGMALLYGFNHDEAARSFRRASELDPDAAMPYWGFALSIGPNYNDTAVDAGAGEGDLRRRPGGARPGAAGERARAGLHPRRRETLCLARSRLGLAGLPPRLQRRDARAGEDLSRRSRRRDAVRREPDDAAALAALDAGRRARAGDARARRRARERAAPGSRSLRREPLLHPRRRGLEESRARDPERRRG